MTRNEKRLTINCNFVNRAILVHGVSLDNVINYGADFWPVQNFQTPQAVVFGTVQEGVLGTGKINTTVPTTGAKPCSSVRGYVHIQKCNFHILHHFHCSNSYWLPV